MTSNFERRINQVKARHSGTCSPHSDCNADFNFLRWWHCELNSLADNEFHWRTKQQELLPKIAVVDLLKMSLPVERIRTERQDWVYLGVNVFLKMIDDVSRWAISCHDNDFPIRTFNFCHSQLLCFLPNDLCKVTCPAFKSWISKIIAVC